MRDLLYTNVTFRQLEVPGGQLLVEKVNFRQNVNKKSTCLYLPRVTSPLSAPRAQKAPPKALELLASHAAPRCSLRHCRGGHSIDLRKLKYV